MEDDKDIGHDEGVTPISGDVPVEDEILPLGDLINDQTGGRANDNTDDLINGQVNDLANSQVDAPRADDAHIEQLYSTQKDISGPPPKKKSSWPTLIIIILLFTAPFAFLLILDNTSSPEEIVLDITIQDVAELRDLEALEDVPFRYISEEEFADSLDGDIDEEALDEFARVLRSLYLINTTEELKSAYVDSLSGLVLGYYDFEAKEMVLIDRGSSTAYDSLTLSHELTHALQDQHFDLGNFTGDSFDESNARDALVEGDATVLMMQYFQSMPTSEQMELISSMGNFDYPDTIYVLDKLLNFPYIEGMVFVQQLHDEPQGWGNWDDVNLAYSNPPVSTEQVLHFEKYLSGEMPLQIDVFIPDNISGLDLTLNDTLGEYMVSIMLENYIPTSMAEEAAAGWGGDRFFYYENEDDWLSCWVIEWDTYSDANEFHLAFDEWEDNPDNLYASEFENGTSVIELHDKITFIYRASDPSLLDGL